ncbi:TIGR03013 family XrtA/PEP-CTERM system glycosyltransferase [Kordiimonas aquimaris]|uniref:TIGR03013 family XrtA/PEP-CTERM system glycosyltransferase n=1 Tax=Kordiimonas aquimaris TaxID=707591 RepID=UPI0021CE552C|nr:TIGR03013 family XrtA/PEP-CTERM system glycosyltransferase [Kordiimonas aquimaris]
MARIFRHHVSPVKLTLAVADFIAVFGSAFLAEYYRYWALDLSLDQTAVSFFAKLTIPIVLVTILLGLGAYQSDAIRDMKVFFVRLSTSLLISIFLLAAIAYLFPVLPLWRSILFITLVISGSLILLIHWLSFVVFKESVLGKRVVVLGAGADAVELIQQAENAPEAGLKIIEAIEFDGDQESRNTLPENERLIKAKINALSNKRSLLEHLSDVDCELIVIGNHFEAGQLPIKELIACKLAGIEVKDRLTFYEEARGYVDLDSVKADWIIFAEGFKGTNVLERSFKRLLDIVISLIFLFLSSPIFLLGILLVRISSRGPVFYKQERVGLNSTTFDVLKLRSMKVDAEQGNQPAFAQENDPRVTPVGHFLRRTRIDELPQLLNVLRGDMSFVGPRPERPYFVEQLEGSVPFYGERHCLKPGITGWAQIRYPYGASLEDSRRKLEYDLYYIKNYSLFLDLLIILQTVRVILFPHGVR